jgi:drug/metabolite transporter (DMT)-like permease
MFTKKKQKILLPILALVIANSLWGFNTIFMKISLETIPPAVSVGGRFFLASLCILPFALKTWKPLKTKYLLLFMLASVISICLSSLVLNTGLKQVPAFNAAVIWLMSPIILLVLSASVLREKINVRTFIGIIIAIAGSMIIIGRPDGGAGGQNNLAGNLLILLAVFFDIIAILMAKPLLKKVSSYQASFLCLFPGSVVVLIYAISQSGSWHVSSVSRASAIAVTLSLIAVAVANLLFYYALSHREAHTVGVYSYLDTLVTIVAAWFILSERPATSFVIGAGLIIAGLYFTEMHKKHRRHLLAKHKI